MMQISKAVGGVVGSGAGLGLAGLALPPDTPWWGVAIVVVVTTFIAVYFAPANRPG
jgi:ABC-type dipeptide/oligopeptide/nickel transport system permease subunit